MHTVIQMQQKFKIILPPWNAGYDELCAPAVGIINDTMLVFGSTYSRNFTLQMSTDLVKAVDLPVTN